jgi:hypothetical protein
VTVTAPAATSATAAATPNQSRRRMADLRDGSGQDPPHAPTFE